MKKVALENFQRNAPRFVARVWRTREPIVITRHGEEVARLVPQKRSLREWIRAAFGFSRKQTKGRRKYASWGVFLKMR